MKKDKKYNIIFLDYDGVINTQRDNFMDNMANEDAIKYLNKLCLENNYDLVISSSWRKYKNYIELFYNFGIDRKIKILGSLDINNKNRAEQIKDYLVMHEEEINNYIILDDAFFMGELGQHAIQTVYSMGFTENKYNEALNKIELFKN